MKEAHKSLVWIGSARKDLKCFADEVQAKIGYGLYLVQRGEMPRNAKPLRGLGRGVTEIRCDHDRDTYRAVYTAVLGGTVYVLHVFKKKSVRGIATPRPDMELIKARLKAAIRLAQEKNNG